MMFGKKVKKPVDEPGGVNVRENTFGKKRKSNLLENGSSRGRVPGQSRRRENHLG